MRLDCKDLCLQSIMASTVAGHRRLRSDIYPAKRVPIRHRYSIEQLADPSPGGAGDFVESCYLLLNGELPTSEQKKEFNYDITRHTMVPEQLIQLYKVSCICCHCVSHCGAG